MTLQTQTLQKELNAPLFNLKDVYNRQIDLSAFKGKKVFLGFFRHAGCPFCNLRVHALTKVHEEFKAMGLEMIFFFESKEQIILRSSFHRGVSPIPIISDPDKKVYAAYGIENSPVNSAISHLTTFVQTAYRAYKASVPIHAMADGESISTMPAEFLLDENLVIRKVHYAKRLNDRMDIEIIREFAKGR